MKRRLILVFVGALMLSTNILYAQGDAKAIAKEVIKAYKTEDVALLKKHVTGMMLYVINDGFFASDDGKPLVEIAKKWDGNIKDIRYSKENMMGKTVLLASVYFSDNPNGNLNVVTLSSFEKSDWKAFAFGIGEISKEEYEQASKEIPGEGKEEKVSTDRAEFSVEMANGETFDAPDNNKLKEALKSLNDDIFFITLSSNGGFLQTSTSENGYIVQYSNGDKMYEAEEYFNLENLIDIFITYIEKGNWKEKGGKWLEM
jgi:hypothetical protein